jgi:pimeloyl-ACP methyl ester carboxylesterase
VDRLSWRPVRRAGRLVVAAFLAGVCLYGCAGTPDVSEHDRMNADFVLLLPGLGRTSRSLQRLQQRLEQEGYCVAALDYPSTRQPVEALASDHLAPAVERCRAAGALRIHFVTHSLGAIVLRYYLAQHPLPEQGRTVMLGPPSQGSEVVDRLGGYAAFRWINGPAGLQLGTGAEALPGLLPHVEGEVAVIAGTRSINWLLSGLIPGRDDGKVSVERTRTPGLTDFATAPVAHPFLMRDRAVLEMVVAFLQTGRLTPGKGPPG